MEELKLLKKDWNKESDEFKNYSEKEIYEMIKQKSVSVTRILCLIGLIEIILWAVYGYIDGELPILRMVLFVVFFALIIYFYFKMKTEESSISLMKNILNIRKVIFGYAGISFFLIVLNSIIDFKYDTRDFIAGFRDGSYGTSHKTDPDTILPSITNYIVFGVVLMITMYLIYLIYKKTYGKILFDLKKNYKELSKVEEN
ncbi:MAG: hypothetical protein WCJ72_06165 [Chryseobacterium sp.]